MKANASPSGMPSRRRRTARSKLAPGRSSILARSPPALAGDSRKIRWRRSRQSGISTRSMCHGFAHPIGQIAIDFVAALIEPMVAARVQDEALGLFGASEEIERAFGREHFVLLAMH